MNKQHGVKPHNCIKLGIVDNTCNPSTQEVDVGESRVQGHSPLHTELTSAWDTRDLVSKKDQKSHQAKSNQMEHNSRPMAPLLGEGKQKFHPKGKPHTLKKRWEVPPTGQTTVLKASSEVLVCRQCILQQWDSFYHSMTLWPDTCLERNLLLKTKLIRAG